MEIILIVLTSTLLSMCLFSVYQFGIKEGIKTANLNNKTDSIEIKDRDNHNRIRDYKQFSEYQG